MNALTTGPRGLVSAIVAGVTPDVDKGVKHQGNWPLDAEFAVEYTLKDKQYPSLVWSPAVVYFESLQAMKDWFDTTQEWIISTDNDISMSCDMYKWDLGPEFIGTATY